VAGFFILGSLFGITTTIQLMELARPTHPLLRQLQMRAPGTYHHSLIISNLAEQAAQRINSDALLVRVGAYYHDVGKSVRPYFFVENQVSGINVHERLDPRTSAQIVIAHVNDGLELAKKYRLPQSLQNFITQHHGNRLASFFYQEALQSSGGEPVDEADFRYPGPKPQSRETAILMLADSVEAAARAAQPHSIEDIDQVVRKIINDRMVQGDLDECDLTLRDLNQISDVFINILQGVYHPRLQYPEEIRPKEELPLLGDPSLVAQTPSNNREAGEHKVATEIAINEKAIDQAKGSL
jgi:cyclic-di-AMP phosphodiesterase PgpH